MLFHMLSPRCGPTSQSSPPFCAPKWSSVFGDHDYVGHVRPLPPSWARALMWPRQTISVATSFFSMRTASAPRRSMVQSRPSTSCLRHRGGGPAARGGTGRKIQVRARGRLWRRAERLRGGAPNRSRHGNCIARCRRRPRSPASARRSARTPCGTALPRTSWSRMSISGSSMCCSGPPGSRPPRSTPRSRPARSKRSPAPRPVDGAVEDKPPPA